ncbi:hypothetical protein ACWEKR_33330 [Nocardia sp. NPDC004573]
MRIQLHREFWLLAAIKAAVFRYMAIWHLPSFIWAMVSSSLCEHTPTERRTFGDAALIS